MAFVTESLPKWDGVPRLSAWLNLPDAKVA